MQIKPLRFGRILHILAAGKGFDDEGNADALAFPCRVRSPLNFLGLKIFVTRAHRHIDKDSVSPRMESFYGACQEAGMQLSSASCGQLSPHRGPVNPGNQARQLTCWERRGTLSKYSKIHS